MATTKTVLTPGTYIGSPMGHYQSAYIIEQARDLGWQPDAEQRYNNGPDLSAEDYLAQQRKEVDELVAFYVDNGEPPHDVEWEVFYEIVQEAEDYINENHLPEPDDDAPEGYWYGHHADIGDVGVWPIEDE